jgi:hypothetical protein
MRCGRMIANGNVAVAIVEALFFAPPQSRVCSHEGALEPRSIANAGFINIPRSTLE